MLRKLKWFFGFVLICIVVIACTGLFWLGPTVKKAVETIGPQVIGAPVTVEKLRIYPLLGTVRVSGLVIGNPEGFTTDHVLSLSDLNIEIDMASLRSDTITIKEILIDAPVFTYEKKSKTDNLTVIRQNIDKYISQWDDGKEKPPQPSETSVETTKKPSKKVVIEHLVVRRGMVKTKIPYLPAAPMPLPVIEKTDIGKDTGGTTWGGALEEIFSLFNDAILDVVSSLGTSAGGIIKDTGSALGDAAAGAIKGIGNLFRKDD